MHDDRLVRVTGKEAQAALIFGAAIVNDVVHHGVVPDDLPWIVTMMIALRDAADSDCTTGYIEELAARDDAAPRAARDVDSRAAESRERISLEAYALRGTANDARRALEMLVVGVRVGGNIGNVATAESGLTIGSL